MQLTFKEANQFDLKTRILMVSRLASFPFNLFATLFLVVLKHLLRTAHTPPQMPWEFIVGNEYSFFLSGKKV